MTFTEAVEAGELPLIELLRLADEVLMDALVSEAEGRPGDIDAEEVDAAASLLAATALVQRGIETDTVVAMLDRPHETRLTWRRADEEADGAETLGIVLVFEDGSTVES